MTTFLAYKEDEKFSLTLEAFGKELEENRAEIVKIAEKRAEDIVSPFAANVRKNIENRGSIMKILISKFRLATAALEAVEVLEKAKALTVPSIEVRLADIVYQKLRLEKAIRENDSRVSYWKAYYESVVAKWKFVEKAEFFGMSIKDMLVITYRNPYLGTYSEKETVMSCRYWVEQTDKIMIDY
jgi:hypothetical protein